MNKGPKNKLQNIPRGLPSTERVRADRLPGEKKRRFFDFGYFFSVISALIVLAVSVLTVGYFVHHLVKMLVPDVTYVSSTPVSEVEYRRAEGYIFRDETVIYTKYSGVPDYALTDGERVAKNGLVCDIYTSLSDDVMAQIEDIEREIALLEASISSGVFAGGLPDALGAVDDNYNEIMRCLGRGDYAGAAALADSFRASLNKVSWLTGQSEDFTLKLSELLGRRNLLLLSQGDRAGGVYADKPGYFFHTVDGYESVFTVDLIKNMTVGSFSQLLLTETDLPAGAVGKMVNDTRWYVAVPLSAEAADGFVEGREYTVMFDDNRGRELDMELDRIILDLEDHDSDGDRAEAVLIFTTKQMPSDFSYLRVQNISIEYKNHDGYRIPTSAIRYYEGMTGVYVVNGGYVMFRQVDVIYEGEGYYFVSLYKDAEPGRPKTYQILGFDDFGKFDDYRDLHLLAEREGWTRKVYDNGGVGVVKGRSLEYYYHLDDHEQVILTGRDLYHGKALN